MAYNNFYNNYNATFQLSVPRPPFPLFHNIPPPPIPPPILPHRRPPNIRNSDQEFLKKFEPEILRVDKKKPNLSIHKIRNKIHSLVSTLNYIKEKEKNLNENFETMKETEWRSILDDIEKNKKKINEIIPNITVNADILRKLLIKRQAKRSRLKRLSLQRKREREDLKKEREERSRKIDENLQKIKDEIEKAKQEEESKKQADLVLKETLRKKNDAKKCVVKLDALVKLRRALHNTAKGRGESVNDNEAGLFENNIEKLKTLWSQKLTQYEQEEANLRAKLNQDSSNTNVTVDTEMEIRENVGSWRNALFGGEMPQVNFQGNIGAFVAVRSEWDQYVDKEGTSIPTGWVVPSACYQL